MLWTSGSWRIAGMRPSHAVLDRLCKISPRHADVVKAGAGLDPDRRAYHMFIRSGFTGDQDQSHLRFLVRSRSDRRHLRILARFKKLHSCFTTNLGMWTDTVTLECL